MIPDLDPIPAAPIRTEPADWEHFPLWKRVGDAVRALPSYFKTSTRIEGILGPDIFTLNAVLGATIEEQVVQTLNELRPVWDPEKLYPTYAFVRQPQRFPDVVLASKSKGLNILLGIELKGWYLLAKEGEPALRFFTTPAVCNPWDLFVVVPWALSNVLSGSPVAYAPLVESARYCAERRNHYWKYERAAKGDTGIVLSGHATPYPKKTDPISDRAVADGGGNFGRMARYGVMDDYVAELKTTALCGIPVSAWLTFFKKFAREQEQDAPLVVEDEVEQALSRAAERKAKSKSGPGT